MSPDLLRHYQSALKQRLWYQDKKKGQLHSSTCLYPHLLFFLVEGSTTEVLREPTFSRMSEKSFFISLFFVVVVVVDNVLHSFFSMSGILSPNSAIGSLEKQCQCMFGARVIPTGIFLVL